MRSFLAAACAAVLVLAGSLHACAQDVPVPTHCTPQVNAELAQIVASGRPATVDNVMVCGTAIGSSRTQHGRLHGDHQVIPLRVPVNGGSALVEVVTNDDLDGVVTARRGAHVAAFGQLYVPAHGRYVAGIHDVHCSTHRGAANGWVVVDETRYPSRC
ncbi:MAG TPA: hypothetical protein VMA36_02760 [Candidatus Limnocylindria bacterium]|nr:hypothetical protein [Candidatus Limnocylindria bacterium]